MNEHELRTACSDLASIEARLAELAALRDSLRNNISVAVAEAGGSVAVPGFGKLMITAPAISFDGDKVEALRTELILDGGPLYDVIMAARKITFSYAGPPLAKLLADLQERGSKYADALAAAAKQVPGSLRIVREKL